MKGWGGLPGIEAVPVPCDVIVNGKAENPGTSPLDVAVMLIILPSDIIIFWASPI